MFYWKDTVLGVRTVNEAPNPIIGFFRFLKLFRYAWKIRAKKQYSIKCDKKIFDVFGAGHTQFDFPLRSTNIRDVNFDIDIIHRGKIIAKIDSNKFVDPSNVTIRYKPIKDNSTGKPVTVIYTKS